MQKIFLNYDQQIEKLKNEKNLLIDNEAYAKEILKQTSYYSLIGGYKDIFKNPTTKNNIGFQRGLELLSCNCGFNSRREHWFFAAMIVKIHCCIFYFMGLASTEKKKREPNRDN